MDSIQIDFDVYKSLTSLRETEDTTYNDVLRKLLNLPPKAGSAASSKSSSPWISKGVSFPEGTEFRATYKGVQYLGVVSNGALVVDGQKYTSPSAAAVAIVNGATNGWNFWECKFPNSSKWELIAKLRKN